MKSIIQNEKQCYVCGTTYNLHDHHIFEGFANRKLSEREGLKIWLCGRHHNLSREGIHQNRELDLKIKKMAQEKWQEKNNKTKEDFIKIFGRSNI